MKREKHRSVFWKRWKEPVILLMLLFLLLVQRSVWAQMPMPDFVCVGETKHYWVDPTPGSTYTWQVNGVLQSSVSHEIYVTWNSTVGSPFLVAVQEKTSSGCKGQVQSGLVYVNPLPIPVITGPANVCAATSGHVYTTQIGMSNYTWSVSSGGVITAGLGTNTITVKWNTPGSQFVSVNYTNLNGCKANTPTTFAVNVSPRPVPTITGPASACLNTPGNTYTTQPGMSNYQWTISSGGTITSGGTTTSNFVTVTWNTLGNQSVKVNYANGGGCSALQATSYPVTVVPTPNPTLSGPTTVCAGAMQNTYTTQVGMTNYQWAISSGGTITAGGGATQNFITVTWTTSGLRTVSVNYKNSSGCFAVNPKVLTVVVNPRPIPTISGPSTACVNSSGNSYTTQTGMSGYTWSVSSGGTITSGAGTSSIAVTWTTTGVKTVTVNYTSSSGCNAVTPGTYSVSVNARPTPTITGPQSLCAFTTGNVYSTQTGMSNYSWSVSSGGVITSGGNSNTITVSWNSPGNQFVKVNYSNAFGCQASSPTQYAVTVKSNTVPTITGVGSVCVNTTVSYITEAGMTNYVWSVSPGNSIVFGNGTRLVTVKWNTAGNQTISVIYNSPGSCPVLTPTVKNVAVNALPTPTITGPNTVCVNALATFSTEAGMTNYSWFIGGTGGIIYSGSTSREVLVKWTQTGSKFLQVNYTTPAGCRASVSTTKNVLSVGCSDSIELAVEEPKEDFDFKVYPNPNDGLFTTSINCYCMEHCSIEVYDLLGKQIYTSGELQVSGTKLQTIDLRGVPDGMYSVVFRNHQQAIVRKVIIRR